MLSVMKFFGLKAAEFKPEWNELSDDAKAELKAGVANGSLTY